MKLELADVAEERVKLLDVQVAPFENGYVLRRGLMRVFLEAPGIEGMLETLIDRTRSPEGACRSELLAAVSEDGRELMRGLIDALEARRVLLPADAADRAAAADVHEGVFYWNFGTTAGSVRETLETRRVAVIGVNHVGTRLAAHLARTGFGEVVLIDHPLFRNVALRDAPADVVEFADWVEGEDLPDCLVVSADFGGPDLMADWNAFCVENAMTFFPVLLHDHHGLIGPLVLPGESACYECVARREQSNAPDARMRRATDADSFFAQHSHGFLAAMADSVAGLAATELLKYYSQALPGGSVGRMLEFDLLEPALAVRRVLKAPRCPVCSSVRRAPTPAADATVFMPGND